MLSLLIYSGKGGVGKTTITYCLYKAFQAQGKKVAVLDMDLNTPSFHHLAKDDDNVISGSENLGLFIDAPQIAQFLKTAKRKIKALNPDILLIDSPPSITHIHYAVMEKLNLSGVILVTQATELSISDVEKTVPFFEQKGITVTGIIENMFEGIEQDYKYNKLASIPREDLLDSHIVYDNNEAIFNKLATSLINMDLSQTSLENRKIQRLDETIDIDTVKAMYSIDDISDYGYFITGKGKTKSFRNIKFVNVATWGFLRDVIMDIDQIHDGFNLKNTVTEATPERVGRLIDAFDEEDKVMVMITLAQSNGFDLIAGEIGFATLFMNDQHHGLPCVQYQTASSNYTLFPHEIMPVDQALIDDCLSDGYTYIENGSRLMPPLEVAQGLVSMFSREEIDISDKWNRIIDLNNIRSGNKQVTASA